MKEMARILVVDDDPTEISLLRNILGKAGHSVQTAPSAEEGLALALANPPDIALLDVVLPGMDGFELCRRLKANPITREVPVLFISISLDEESRIEGFEAGGVDYISKPFFSKELLMRIRTQLDLRRLQAALKAETELRITEMARANLQLQQELTERKQAEAHIAQLNEELEARVHKRTAELAKTNAQLQETLDTLQRAQSQLIRSEKLASLGALVAGVAHELNTPLGNSYTISTTLQEVGREFMMAFEKGELKRSSLKRYAEQIQEASELISRNLYRASEMITHFKQVTADQTSAQRRKFELHECVEEIVSTLQPQFKRTTHKIQVNIPSELLFDSYPGPLGQVITNIVLNALFHAFDQRENGIIDIEAVPLASDRVRLSISDNGCGIPPENMPRIFDPFFTTRLGSGGSGLGLHIVYSIVTRVLGGNIDVVSNEGKGTRFIMEIPFVAPVPPKKDVEI